MTSQRGDPVPLSKNLSNAGSVRSVRRYIVAHALFMRGKSLRLKAPTDCMVVRDIPMISSPPAPASPPRQHTRSYASSHLLPQGRSERRTAPLYLTPTSARPVAPGDGPASGEPE
jgi:hypothetical protein